MKQTWVMPTARPVLDAALSILADGKPRSATEIFADGVKRGLFEPQDKERIKFIDESLALYIERAHRRGHKPLVVQDDDRRFRLNRPIDDWSNDRHDRAATSHGSRRSAG